MNSSRLGRLSTMNSSRLDNLLTFNSSRLDNLLTVSWLQSSFLSIHSVNQMLQLCKTGATISGCSKPFVEPFLVVKFPNIAAKQYNANYV